MGLASSQARLLNLTARMHQIEYSAARVEAMKLQMANESRRVYEDYLEALDQAKVQKKTLTTNGAVTFVDIKNYQDFLDAGFALVVHGGPDGSVVCTNETMLKDAIAAIFTGEDGNPLNIEDGLSEANFEQTLTNLINSGSVTIVQKYKDEDGNMVFPTNVDSNEFKDNETSIAINTSLQEVTDEVKLRKAEAKYEADMKRIDMKDRRYDTELAALDNERNAIKQEMETLKTVAKDNVERTFKIFS